MSNLTIGLLSALLATNQPQAVSNLVQQQTGVSVAIPNDPEERELDQVMEDDDAALDEVDKWIQENNAFTAQGGGESKAELNRRIRARLDSVRTNYEAFLQRHPRSANGALAYGSFLNDIGDEYAALAQYEKSRQLDPKNPAVWNDLANYYGEFGPVTNAFADYAKAIELDPTESVYYQNLATTVYLFRKDAREYYGLTEQQVFDKALALYRQAMKQAPNDFVLATDYAESYYGIKPLRAHDALAAWTNALHVAATEAEREGVYIHLARVNIAAGSFADARADLDLVTNAAYSGIRERLERNLAERESGVTNEFTARPPKISTNAAAPPTNAVSVKTAPRLTNGVPAMTNPPAFSPKNATVMTNVPPDPPKPTRLEASAPVPPPQPPPARASVPPAPDAN